MDAGRALDAAVAEKIMGWVGCDAAETYRKWEFGDPGDDFAEPGAGVGTVPDTNGRRGPFPRYSTDVAAAWPLVERFGLWVMPNKGQWVACRPDSLSAKSYEPDMYFDVEFGIIDGHLQDIATAATAPLAICLAALKAVGALGQDAHDRF